MVILKTISILRGPEFYLSLPSIIIHSILCVLHAFSTINLNIVSNGLWSSPIQMNWRLSHPCKNEDKFESLLIIFYVCSMHLILLIWTLCPMDWDHPPFKWTGEYPVIVKMRINFFFSYFFGQNCSHFFKNWIFFDSFKPEKIQIRVQWPLSNCEQCWWLVCAC